MINENVVNAGKDIANCLISARCSYSMAGLGGCEKFDINKYPIRYHSLILDYVLGKIESVEAIYVVMREEEQKENRYA